MLCVTYSLRIVRHKNKTLHGDAGLGPARAAMVLEIPSRYGTCKTTGQIPALTRRHKS